MSWIVIGLGAVIALVALAAAIGLTLRADHQCARTIAIARSPAEVWAVIADPAGYPAWRRDLTRVELLADGGFREHGRHDAIAYTLEDDRPPTAGASGRRVTRIVDAGLPYGGRWIIAVAAEGDATRVSITEDGFIRNPIFRVLSRTVFSVASTQERWLTALARHLGSAATPTPTPPAS
ncbi:MAG: SRPBCC family protein [Myxococcales bacterium]|nr:SRPBCC family protein [Myxococcales bacterium]